MPAIGAAPRFAAGAAFPLGVAVRAVAFVFVAGFPFAAGLFAGFFLAGIGIVMPGMFMPCID
jgi:hypothetical protein